MVISYDYGHLEGNSQDGSANGIVYEYAEVRKYGLVVVNELIRQGHTLVDCTPPNNPMTVGESLAYRVNKANASGSELHLCFHINAFNGQAHGAECEVASDNGQKYADSILREIYKLGFTPRGVNRPNLYVTKNTNMVAVLIEPFFCDSAVDVALYNCNTLGVAIAQGIVNIIGSNAKPVIPVVAPVEPIAPINNSGFHVEYRTHVQNIGWTEWVRDGAISGTVGQSLRVEAIEIRIV